MQLKKEVSELTLQRDLAQSQVKDLVQVLGDDKLSPVCISKLKNPIYFNVLHVLSSVCFYMNLSGYGSLLSQIATANFMGIHLNSTQILYLLM